MANNDYRRRAVTTDSNNRKNIRNSSLVDTFFIWEAPLRRFIGRFLHKPEDIDDMAQETFLRAYTVTRHEQIHSPKSYLFRVAKNVALKELTKKSRQITDFLEEAQQSEVEDGESLEERVVAEQKISLYFDAIAELPPQCRRVFLMRKYQGLSHREIARELGITTSAVEKHIALGAERCKKFIDSREQGEPTADLDLLSMNSVSKS